MTKARAVAEFIVQSRLDDFPAEVTALVKLALQDTLGVALAGSTSRVSRVTREFLSAFPMSPREATLWGAGGRQAAPWAALANGLAASCLDADDGHRGALGHPGAVVVPAALAAAERAKASGAELLAGLTVGYEVGLRSGLVLNRRQAEIYHGSGTWACLGAAAAAARILGLDEEACLAALGIAEIHAPLSLIMGWIEARRPPEVKEGIGWGAFTGLCAALLAERGMKGTFSLADQAEGRALSRSLGREYEISRLYFKGFPACRWTHAAIEAALLARQELGLTPETIKSVVVGVHAKAAHLDNPAPTTIEEAEYSIPFLVSAALVSGRVGPQEVSEAGLADGSLASLAGKVKVRLDPQVEARYPQQSMARMEIATFSGRTVAVPVEAYVRGDFQRPFTVEELAAKFRTFAGQALPQAQVTRLGHLLARVERLESVARLGRLLRPKAPRESCPGDARPGDEE